MIIYFARMYLPAFPNKLQYLLREFPARGWPGSRSFGWHIDFRTGMHQRLKCLRHKPVHDEEVFLYLELRIQPFEIPGAVIFYAMAQSRATICART